MNIYICDDNIEHLNNLHSLLINFFDNFYINIPTITTYTDGESLLSDSASKDIVFLDVKMNGLNGITVGHQLKKQNKNCIIIMVTSFSEYLDDAFNFQAFRYLQKPIDNQRLFRSIKEAIQLYNSFFVTVTIESKTATHIINTDEIIKLEYKNKKVYVSTHKGVYPSIHSLDYWESKLPKNTFFRSHKSFIVNMEHVSDFDHQLIYFNNFNETAYLTKRKYTNFKQSFSSYLEFKK